MTVTPARQRAYVGITFQLGLFTVRAETVPIRKTNSSKEGSFKSICPDCQGAVNQFYKCDNGHGPYTTGELSKAREEGGALVPLSEEEVQIVKGQDAVGVMELHACPAWELEAKTRIGDKCYRIRPVKAKALELQSYTLLLDLARDTERALYGMCKLTERSNADPFRLEEWRGQLVIQSLIRPQTLAETDDLGMPPPLASKLINLGTALVAQETGPFDPDIFSDNRVIRLQQVLAAKTGVAAPVAPKVKAPEDDLMALLEASMKKG